jgi:transcriptional regulator with XRE-family HTH domain
MATTPTRHQLLLRAQESLHLNQKQLGALLGLSSRTIGRWYRGGGGLYPGACEKLARATHPLDAALAKDLAARGGTSLVALGLEKPPAPSVVKGELTPLPAHLADSIVCVAAEAVETTPKAMRPALVAAFERALALGMTAEEVLGAMKAGKKEPPSRKGAKD